MQRQLRRDTTPELELRRELHSRGLRFFVCTRPVASLRCRADVVFPRARVAVEIRGCFWHFCPRHRTVPKANAAWWLAKLTRTFERDNDSVRRLRAEGWLLVVVWEHEDVDRAADRVCRALERRRPADRG